MSEPVIEWRWQNYVFMGLMIFNSVLAVIAFIFVFVVLILK
jgi:hypothetical protein